MSIGLLIIDARHFYQDEKESGLTHPLQQHLLYSSMWRALASMIWWAAIDGCGVSVTELTGRADTQLRTP
jgi:hypothetical protein